MQNRANNLGQNSLERGLGGCKTYRKPKQRPKVTIAIGFIRKSKPDKIELGQLSSIWMASDSQATYGETKRENPNKINVVDFANGQILVAQAGSVELGDKTVEKLQQKSTDLKMDDAETAIKAVRSALLEVRTELLEWNKGVPIDLEKFFWTEHRLNLLVGYFFKMKPYLFKTDIYSGIYSKVPSFEAIGNGQSLGYYLLKEYSKSDPDMWDGFPIAVSVVEKVIENVDGCSAPTWVGTVYPIPFEIQSERHKIVPSLIQCQAIMVPQYEIGLASQELKIADARGAALRKKEILRVMNRISKKYTASAVKRMNSENKRREKRSLAVKQGTSRERIYPPENEQK